jgi:hypothetical protein
MAVAWDPQGDGLFVVAHADGNIYVYDKVNYPLAIMWNVFIYFPVPFVLTC